MNYARLIALLPGMQEGTDAWQFEVGKQSRIAVSVVVVQRSPYTTLIELEQGHSEMDLPRISIRLSHDADVAEVVSWDGHRHWQAKYNYPNPQMYQPDEKVSLNRFISDWLHFCRNYGLASDGNCESDLVSRR